MIDKANKGEDDCFLLKSEARWTFTGLNPNFLVSVRRFQCFCASVFFFLSYAARLI